jgi:hypothetical protein
MDGNACFVMGATTHDSCKKKRSEAISSSTCHCALSFFFCYNKEEPILNVTPQKKKQHLLFFFLEHASAKYYALTVRSGHKKKRPCRCFQWRMQDAGGEGAKTMEMLICIKI